MPKAVIALGSNLGDRVAHLENAISAIRNLPQTLLLTKAKHYDTTPVDVPKEFETLRFLNTAILVETTLSPEELLTHLLAIEDKLGRIRTVRNGPRTIDLDLIAYEGERRQTAFLTIPHPRAKERDFVLLPLRDLGITLETF